MKYTEEIRKINDERNRALHSGYDPLRGIGCCLKRRQVSARCGTMLVPEAMVVDNPDCAELDVAEFERIRFRYDFEFWAAKTVFVPDKMTHRLTNLVLNPPQREVLRRLENMRTANMPVRAIILKARQCGISTLIEAYIAWMQLIRSDCTNAIICAQNRDTAQSLKGIYATMLANYPEEYGAEKPYALRPYQRTSNIVQITGRSNTVTTCSAESPAAIRGLDIALAHLSEVAFWRKTARIDPMNMIRSIGGTVALTPESVVVMESTANGLGNFFHEEWLRASAGISDKTAIFVPWFRHNIYELPIDNPEEFCASLNDYENGLWLAGASLEQIKWYRYKNREYARTSAMQAEFPTTDVEAFTATDRIVFSPRALEQMRKDCRAPESVGEIAGDAATGRDALNNVHFVDDATGRLKVWQHPDPADRSDRYIVAVDLGGRADESDFSVIYVLDRGATPADRPQTAAQWRGHDDLDIVAWKAAQVAKYYRNALLVVESNTLETKTTDGENSGFVLSEISNAYPNLYRRKVGCKSKPGFHTNRTTKPLILNRHIANVRDLRYIERDNDAINEHLAYERKPNGSFGAKEGHHDDILMTRCIALSIDIDLPKNKIFNFEQVKQDLDKNKAVIRRKNGRFG